jgi:transposase
LSDRAVEEAGGLMDGLDVNAMFGALGLSVPGRVVSVEFDQQAGRHRAGLPSCRPVPVPAAGMCAESACAVHDTVDKTWRHLDFFQD